MGVAHSTHARGARLQNLLRVICRSSCNQFVKQMLLDVHRTIVFLSVRWKEITYRFAVSVLGAQKKVIAAMVRGLLDEALKHHVRVPQLANIVGPPYLRSKQ